jgi:hypothetical protein
VVAVIVVSNPLLGITWFGSEHSVLRNIRPSQFGTEMDVLIARVTVLKKTVREVNRLVMFVEAPVTLI